MDNENVMKSCPMCGKEMFFTPDLRIYPDPEIKFEPLTWACEQCGAGPYCHRVYK